MIEAKYNDISQKLEEKIKNGTYTEKLPGVFKLAKELKVSHLTIVKSIKSLAEKGMLTVIPSKGTFVTGKHQSRPRYDLICIVGGMEQDIKATKTLKLIEVAAQKRGFKSMALTVSHANILTNPTFLSEIQVDGYIFIEGALFADGRIANNLKLAGIPFISLNRMPRETGISWVDFDNERALEETFQHLYKLGHRKIAYIGFANNVEFHRKLTYNCYYKFMKKHKIFNKEFFMANITGDQCRSQLGADHFNLYAQQQLKQLSLMKRPPTAAFIDNYKLAFAFYMELKNRGINIPEDFSIVSNFDGESDEFDLEFFSILEINQTKRILEAVKALTGLINKQKYIPIHKYVKRDLKIGKSTAPPIKNLTFAT